MTGVLLRTGSVPFHRLNVTGSINSTFSHRLHDFFSEIRNDTVFSPKPGLRRSVSDTNIFRSGSSRISSVGSASFSSLIVESEEEQEIDLRLGNTIPVDIDGIPGGGVGNGRRYGGDRGSDGGKEDRSDIGDYYEKMVKANPSDSLLLRNYGKYLHEVVKDTARAEEYYGRAILASPGDGELLSLYGKLLWETQRDGERAKSYFDQAVHAAPDDCTVWGSYAHFLWEADEEEDEEEEVPAADAAAAMSSSTC